MLKNFLRLAPFLLVCFAQAQTVSNPKASLIDVAARHAALAHNTDARTARAIHSLASCVKLAEVPAPTAA